ncbi:MAG: diacylglycerol kinase [Gammaproteobacteria bacterium]|nr:diacylglycerol kinase [Gammaproteobacteria bacterium]
MKNKPFIQRLSFALQGIKASWQSERSFRTQSLFALLLLPLLIILQPALIWWAISTLIAVLVLAAELINTALEHLVDHLHPEQHPRIKIVKDCAAGAVLILSAGAVIIAGLMIYSTE